MMRATSSHHALVIGVGGDLPGTASDATALAGLLVDAERCGYSPAGVRTLTCEEASRDAILHAFDEMARVVDEDAAALVYFSGHGYHVTTPFAEAYYLLPNGYDIKSLRTTAISGAEFTAKLAALRCRRLLLLLDCCHAGGIAGPLQAGVELAKSPVPGETASFLAQGQGRVLIASSTGSELSFAGRPYSAFTLALMEALCGLGVTGGDGLVRVSDLALHARQVVPGRTQNRQHPILNFERADNFPVAYYAGGDAQPKGLPFSGPVEIEPEPGRFDALINQANQVVNGAQTNITGNVTGQVLSGQFSGPVYIGRAGERRADETGEAVETARRAQRNKLVVEITQALRGVQHLEREQGSAPNVFAWAKDELTAVRNDAIGAGADMALVAARLEDVAQRLARLNSISKDVKVSVTAGFIMEAAETAWTLALPARPA